MWWICSCKPHPFHRTLFEGRPLSIQVPGGEDPLPEVRVDSNFSKEQNLLRENCKATMFTAAPAGILASRATAPWCTEVCNWFSVPHAGLRLFIASLNHREITNVKKKTCRILPHFKYFPIIFLVKGVKLVQNPNFRYNVKGRSSIHVCARLITRNNT